MLTKHLLLLLSKRAHALFLGAKCALDQPTRSAWIGYSLAISHNMAINSYIVSFERLTICLYH